MSNRAPVRPGSCWTLSRPLKPLVWQWRKQPEFISKVDPRTSDDVFMKNEYLYGVDLRAGMGFGFWQMAAAQASSR